jgi:hypothetical protein
VLGGEPELGCHDAGVRGDGQRPEERLVAERRTQHVAAPVEVEDRRGGVGARRQHERRHAAGVDRGDRDLGGRCELSVELLVGIAARLEPGVPARHREHRRPELGQAPRELAADRERRGDRLVDVVEQPAGAVEQRLARDRQLDAVRRAAQQVAAQ